MKTNHSLRTGCLLLLVILMGAACVESDKKEKKQLIWQRMSDIPAENKDFAKGVSALFAGVHQGKVILAGGCNFPDVPAAEGGKKVFYKDIYVADVPAGDSVFLWKKAGELPVSAAYGVSVSTPEGVICVGGSNGEGSLSSVWRLSWEAGQIRLDTLPSLPVTMDNMAGTVSKGSLYVMGGNVNGKPSNAVYSLALAGKDVGWKEELPFPGEARVQPVCVSQRREGEDCLYLLGGFAGAYDGRPATVSFATLCYEPTVRRWSEMAAPTDEEGEMIALGGGVGINLTDTTFLCMGGVNKDIFLAALQREANMKKAKQEKDESAIDSLAKQQKAYMEEPGEYYRFNRKLLLYSSAANRWKVLDEASQAARAGAVAVREGNSVFLINGELKPGIRTPEVWRLEIHPEKKD